jgi:hypothetical protein
VAHLIETLKIQLAIIFILFFQQGSTISHEAEIQSSNDWAAPAAWGKSGSIDRQTSIDTTNTQTGIY